MGEHAIFLDAPEDTLLERCRGRLVHEPSGRQYHDQFKPPLTDGVDDFTGDALKKPQHDEADFHRSLGKYREDAGLLKEFFKRTEMMREVDASGGADHVATACSEVVKGKKP